MAETGKQVGKVSQKKQIDFIVTTANPNDASTSKANKKRVRSVAALKSWPERRKKMFQQFGKTGMGRGAFLINKPVQENPQSTSQPVITVLRKWPESRTKAFQQSDSTSTADLLIEQSEQQAQWNQQPPPLYVKSRLTPPRVPPGFTDSSPRYLSFAPIPDRTTPPRDGHTDGGRSSGFAVDTPGSSLLLYQSKAVQLDPPLPPPPEVHGQGLTMPCSCTQCLPTALKTKKRMADGSDKRTQDVSSSVILVTPPSSPNKDAARGRADPFNCYTVPWQPFFDQILHHMMSVYAPRGWPALRITREQGVRWEWFLTQNALSEPALFYVRLLFGSGDLIRLGGMRTEIRYWLREQAIKAINEALDDPVRACSDALILAVGRIAIHEHMYGDRYASVAIHRPAQKRMIDMRGGMRNLNFPELVKRLMRWSDGIMAVGTKTERMLDDDEANPNFTLRESVHAIEKWAPQEMPRVRTVINLKDLIDDEENGR